MSFWNDVWVRGSLLAQKILRLLLLSKQKDLLVLHSKVNGYHDTDSMIFMYLLLSG